MKKTLRMVCVWITAVMLLCLTGCGAADNEPMVVRYLNFKPEIAEEYAELAQLYEEKTGVKVVVETAANNTYEQTLAARMGTKEAPTLFQINGPRGYAAWKDYCADLSGTELYKHLSDKSLAVTDGARVVGIPYVVEGYGIIYNKAITDAYFALPDRAATVASMDEINTFTELKAVVEDMHAHRGELGIDGVFASTSLKSGEDWRWQTHLLNIPLHYEFTGRTMNLADPDNVKTVDFTHESAFKNIFDLYLQHSVTDPKLVGSKTVADSMAEFALERCAMVQNGNWAWGQIKDVEGNRVEEENVRFLPIYAGVEGEESQGLAIGTENYYAINRKATDAQQKAAADFVYWLYSSEEGKEYVAEEFGFIAPFDTFTEEDAPDDPLARQVAQWMRKEGVTTVPWHFTLFPSTRFKEDFGASLLKYAQGGKDWDAVVQDMKDGWKQEASAAAI